MKTGRRKTPPGRNGACPTSRSPVFGYKNHIVIDRAYGFIRSSAVSDAARHDGKMLRHLVTSDNLAAGVWADSAYRSKANEVWLAGKGRVSHIHRKKPKGRAMPRTTARARRRTRCSIPSIGPRTPLGSSERRGSRACCGTRAWSDEVLEEVENRVVELDGTDPLYLI